MFRTRFAVILVVFAAVGSAGTGQALVSHGGGGSGGGGGGGTSSPPATAPAVSLSPSSLTYGPQTVGATSASQVLTLSNIGTGSLFINGVSIAGINALDFNRTDDQCVGTSVAAGASCTITVVCNPIATGTRTATLSIVDTAPNSPQAVTLTGTGTSVNGPTPLSVNTTGLTCSTSVCQFGIPGDTLVKNFFFTSLGILGQTTPPFTWTLSGGSLPPGLTLLSNGQILGTPTATGTFTFTVRVTDAAGQTATQAFSQTISPQPPPLTQAQRQCQHAPGSTIATLAGPAISGQSASGQAIGDQS